MKTSIMKYIATLTIAIAILTLTSCMAGSEEVPSVTANQNETPIVTGSTFSLKVALVDSEGKDITTKNVVQEIALFVFDQNEKFYNRINIDSQSIIERREVKITCPGSERITVIAWGGLTEDSETIANLSQGNSSISDFTLSLNHEEGIANPAGDIFYGQHLIRTSINPKSANTSNELVMERKVASISLGTSGITASPNDIFSYKIKNTKSAFNYNGELTGEAIEYIIPASFDKKGNLTTSTISIFPSSKITIELYKNDELIFSAEKDENSKNLAANSGKLLDVFFDYSSTLSVQTTIVPWGVVIQNIVIG